MIWDPRFEHVDAERKEQSPKAARDGDTLELAANVGGADPGESVTFTIFDVTNGYPGRALGSVRGPNEDGRAKARWRVTDPRPEDSVDALSLDFEAKVRTLFTQRVAIPLRYQYVQWDLDELVSESAAYEVYDQNDGSLLFKGESDDDGMIETQFRLQYDPTNHDLRLKHVRFVSL